MIAIGRVFSTSFAMFRQRFWSLVGMWAVFFAIQIVTGIGLLIGISLFGLAGMAAFGAGFDDEAALTGMGIGMIVLLAVFYGAFLTIFLAQQAALVALASPLERPAFGPALVRGFKSVLPFLGLTVIVVLANFAVSAALEVIAGGGSSAGGAVSGVLALVLLPVSIYVLCRLAVVVPVVAVDEVYNPFKVLRRSWMATHGKALGVLLVGLGTLALGLVVFGVPTALVFVASDVSMANGAPATGMVALFPLLMLPVLILYTLFVAAVNAALHSEVTQGGAEKLEEVFA